MKKNVEWLKGLINEEGIVMDMNLLGRHDEQYWKNENIKINKGRLFYLINQLDEPETLSQEWIDKYAQGDYDGWVYTEDLQNLLVPKQELPVIPKFVADWIKFKKESRIPYENVLQAIDELVNSSTSKAHDWVLKTSENKDAFARAWLDGYTVEEEQKYRVIDSHKVYLLAKEEDRNEVETVAKLVEIYGYNHAELDYNLTEQEIKDYDDRFWAFAVKVEEMEE